mmetsp:Transcript_46956/g.119094  ORF Transcript_46956/g.119094 Transcript_46956/m.119094 type:complete len:276 (-) Transcript_46956:315-1142(-)
MLRLDGIEHKGEVGQFRAHETFFSWSPIDRGEPLTRPAASVMLAEWFEGQFRVLCGTEILAFSGFLPMHFESLWCFFEQQSGVLLKKLQRIEAPPPEADFDTVLEAIWNEIGNDSNSQVAAAVTSKDVGSGAVAPALMAGSIGPVAEEVGIEARSLTKQSWRGRDSILEGWAWKRSRHLKSWRRRWLILRRDMLLSFKAVGDVDATEIIPVGGVSHVFSADEHLGLPRAFCISSQGRNYYIACDFEADKQDWMCAFAQVVPCGPGKTAVLHSSGK